MAFRKASLLAFLGVSSACEVAVPEKVPPTSTTGAIQDSGTTLDAPPLVALQELPPDVRRYSDVLVRIEGTVSDPEDAAEALLVTLSSDVDGELGAATPSSEGAVVFEVLLSENQHSLTVSAQDSAGNVSTDTVEVVVGAANTPPDCGSASPEDGAANPEGTVVSFRGWASDPDVGFESLAAVWASDVSGVIWEGAPDSEGNIVLDTSTLPLATHLFTLTVTDEVGGTCVVETQYTVGIPPTISLSSPTDGRRVNDGDVVSLSAVVSDFEDDASDLVVTWTSDLDGALVVQNVAGEVSGEAFLSPGVHTLVTEVRDSHDLSARDTRTVEVNALPTAPTVVLTPIPAVTTDALSVSASGSVDPDGSGAVTYSFAWTEDGIPMPSETAYTLGAAQTRKHMTYEVTVTPRDDFGAGTPATAQVTIDNSAPVLFDASLSASSVKVGETLVCSASVSDVDGDIPSLNYMWSNGTVGASLVVAASDNPGDLLTCTVTADDLDGGTDVVSISATVENTDPTIDSIGLSSATARVGETLTCGATAHDEDGDAPTISYAWSDGTTGATYTLTASDNPGDAIVCTATALDPDGGSATLTASATVENTEPVLGVVTISPTSATNDDVLTCAATASDVDGDAAVYSYSWSGSASGALGTGPTLDLATTAAESLETITCLVTASDPHGGSDTGTSGLVLSNRAPSVVASLSPASPAVGDTIVCDAWATDLDDDTPTNAFVWTVNGSVVAATASSADQSALAGAFVKGDVVNCEITTDDGKGGLASASATTTISNTAPEVTSVVLSPSVAGTDDALSVVANVYDADGDAASLVYTWSVDGTVVLSGPSDVLDGGTYFDRDQWVEVLVEASDGTDAGSTSTGMWISNTVPGAPVVAITPSDVAEGEALLCEVVTESEDIDGDVVSYTFAWTVDGVAYEDGGDSGDTGATTPLDSTNWPGDTVPAGVAQEGEEWECIATPDDGSDDGATASTSIVVAPAGCRQTIELYVDGVLEHSDVLEVASAAKTLYPTFTVHSTKGYTLAGASIDNVLLQDNAGNTLYSTSFGSSSGWTVTGGAAGSRSITGGRAYANSDWQTFKSTTGVSAEAGIEYSLDMTWTSTTDRLDLILVPASGDLRSIGTAICRGYGTSWACVDGAFLRVTSYDVATATTLISKVALRSGLISSTATNRVSLVVTSARACY